MIAGSSTLLVVGATGNIGSLVVGEAVREGYAVRALVRDPARAGQLPPEAQLVVGDLTRPDTLPDVPCVNTIASMPATT